MEDDMMLLCQNARTYNHEGSQIYADSQDLETGFLSARARLESGVMDFGDSDEEQPFASAEVMDQVRSCCIHVLIMWCPVIIMWCHVIALLCTWLIQAEGYISDNSDGKLLWNTWSLRLEMICLCFSYSSFYSPFHPQAEDKQIWQGKGTLPSSTISCTEFSQIVPHVTI